MDFHQQQIHRVNFMYRHSIISLPVSFHNVFVQWLLCIFPMPICWPVSFVHFLFIFSVVENKTVLSPDVQSGFFPKFSIVLFGDRLKHMMKSLNGNIFRVTGHLCGEFTGPPVNSPHKGQWRGVLIFTLICARINGWANNREAGDLRRHRAHYDVIVMRTSWY